METTAKDTNNQSSWRAIETNSMFADRISDVPKSFIREILKVAISEKVISFAGGLPNRELFPAKELQIATNEVFEHSSGEALQYSNTEGYMPLREFIARRYKTHQGLDVDPRNILITTGSQQGLDLLGKTFINDKDNVIIEKPGYLGAIQLFSVYRANFLPVELHSEGMNIQELEMAANQPNSKLMYAVPNFSNPSGITYSNKNREAIARILKGKPTFIIEDDPYGELRYKGESQKSFKHYLPDQTILLGSFSKTVVPSFRTGWIVAPDEIMDKLIVAKQASDLHTNFFTQKILHEYLNSNDIDKHINKIREVYGKQLEKMVECIKNYFPSEVEYTLPEGGMFLWVTLPKGISTMKLFDSAIKEDIAFVPGNPFYTMTISDIHTLRLNFSCVDVQKIEIGIKKLGLLIDKFVH